MSLTRTRRLRQALAGERAVMAPGVVDAMYARLVAEAGFEAMYMTGAGTSASDTPAHSTFPPGAQSRWSSTTARVAFSGAR